MFIDDVHPRQSMDVFSVGALAYRLFTGEYPFERRLKHWKHRKRTRQLWRKT